MKILFISNGLTAGGAEKLINDLLPRLKEDGIQCSLLILSKDNEKYIESIEKNGIKVDVLPKTRNHFRRIILIRRYIAHGSFDLIHAHLFPTIYYISILKRIYRDRFPQIIMTEHNTDNKRRHILFLRPIEQLIYSKYDKVISISEQTEIMLLKWLKLKKSNTFVVINNGIPVKHFTEALPCDRRDLFQGIQSDDLLLCMVGSFTEQKNHDLMISILLGLPVKYKLILLGEGPLSQQIMCKVKKYQIEQRVRFLGYRSDVASVMKSSDVIVIPSKWEGFGLVAVEAMACRRPVIASDVPGLAQIVEGAGLLAQSQNQNDFISKIIALEDMHLYSKIVQLGQAKAEKYSIEYMKREYESIYDECTLKHDKA